MEWDRELTEWERKWDGVEEGVGWSGRGSWIEIGMEWEREWDGVGKRAVWSWRGTEWEREWEREWTRERDEDEVRVVEWSGRGSGIMWKRQ